MAWHDGASGLLRRWSVSESRLSDEIARFRVGLMMSGQTGVWPGGGLRGRVVSGSKLCACMRVRVLRVVLRCAALGELSDEEPELTQTRCSARRCERASRCSFPPASIRRRSGFVREGSTPLVLRAKAGGSAAQSTSEPFMWW